MTARVCIIPLNAPDGGPRYDAAGERIRCGQAVPLRRAERLCDEHYAAVNDAVVARQIDKALGSEWWKTGANQ